MGMVNEADVRRIEGWRAGKLNFDKQPLRLAVEEFNRYTNRKVFLASADIGELPVSGVLEIGDVDSLILLLRESIGLSVEWSEKQVVVKSKWS